MIHGHMVGALKLTQPQVLCHIHVVLVFCAMNGYNSKQLVPLSVGLNQEALLQLISLDGLSVFFNSGVVCLFIPP